MTLGDVVSEENIKQKNVSKLKNDLFPDFESSETKIKVVEDITHSSSKPEEKGQEFVEKYKNKTAIGSDDINNHSSTYKKDLSKFEGKSGFGSDDLSSKPVKPSSSCRLI